MNGNQLTKIKKALLYTELIEIRSLEALPQADMIPSNEYNEKINEIISGKRNERTGVIKSPRRIAALIIATMIIASLAVTAVAFRKELKGFFVEIFESFTRLTSAPTEDVPKVIEKRYTIPTIPDGFVLIDEGDNEIIAQTLWLRDNDMLCLEQSVIGATIGMDTENGEYEKIEVNGFEGHKTYKDGIYTLTWIDAEYAFCIVCSDTVPFEDILEMAENLSVKEAGAE